MSAQPNLNRSRLAAHCYFAVCGVYGSLAPGGIGGYLFRLSWNLASISKHCIGYRPCETIALLDIVVQISWAQCELQFIRKRDRFASK